MDNKLLKILSDVFEINESKLDMEFTKDDIDSWDSLKQMDLVVSIENGYGINLEMDDIIKMDSIKTIVEVVKMKINK